VTFLIIAPYKYSYLLTYLLTYLHPYERRVHLSVSLSWVAGIDSKLINVRFSASGSTVTLNFIPTMVVGIICPSGIWKKYGWLEKKSADIRISRIIA